jgi:cobalt-zinc-cadmium efflux system outer membrane protein
MRLHNTATNPAWLLTWFAAAIVVCATARGETLTLSAATSEALEHNPEIRAFSADVAAARGEVMTAVTWENPELAVSPGARNTKASGKTTTEFHSVFELKQTIEFPGKRSLRRALAQKSVESRQLALAGFRSQLAIQVRRVFYTLLASRQVAVLKEQRVASAKTFAEAARKKVEGGFAPEFEATKAEVEVVSAQRAHREVQAQVATAGAALSTLLGRKPGDVLEITGTLSEPVIVPDETNVLRQVFARNPSFKAQEAEVERTGLSAKSVRKSRLPDFTIGPSVEYLQDEQTYDFGISLPLPLWDRKKGAMTTATAEQEKAVAELDKLRQEILRDVTTAYHNLASAKESLALYTPEFLGKLRAALDAASQSYTEGRTTLLIYLETQRTYFDAQADYFETLQKLYDATAELETAVGVPLSELQENVK